MHIKASLIITAAVFFMLLGITACEPEEEAITSNYFTLGEESYTLAEGFLEYYGKISSGEGIGYNHDVYVVSENIDFANGSGSGDFVYFQMYSSDENQLQPGEYSYDASSSEAPHTFDTGAFAYDYNFAREKGTMVFLQKGTISVTKDSNSYEINFQGQTTEGEFIEGNFKGVFSRQDYSRKAAPKKRFSWQ